MAVGDGFAVHSEAPKKKGGGREEMREHYKMGRAKDKNKGINKEPYLLRKVPCQQQESSVEHEFQLLVSSPKTLSS